MRNDYGIRPRAKLMKGKKGFPDLTGDGKISLKVTLPSPVKSGKPFLLFAFPPFINLALGLIP